MTLADWEKALAAKLWAMPRVWPVSWAESWRMRARTIWSMGSWSGVMLFPFTEGAEGYVALDDLAGAWVGNLGAVAPASGVAVNPLDDVVADVHGVGVGGEDVDAEGVVPAGSGEGLVPPAGAFEECGADGFGGSTVDVVLDGGYGLAVGLAGGIFFDEAVAGDELLVQRGA